MNVPLTTVSTWSAASAVVPPPRTIAPRGLDHLGIAVAALDEACRFYQDVLGASLEGIEPVADQQVRVAFLRVGWGASATCIELLEPTDPSSPIARFLEKRGPGLHHVAYAVDDVAASLAAAEQAGIRLIDRTPRRGAHGAEIAFLHPQSTGGLLIELCRRAEPEANHLG